MNKLAPTKAEAVIKTLEGYSALAYKPVPGDRWTCGWGSTRNWFTEQTTCTMDVAQKWLDEDLDLVVRALQNLIKVPVTPCQADALIILCYNIGVGTLAASKACELLNAGDYDGFAHQAFDPVIGFVKIHGRVVQGLVNRRQLELNIWKGL